MKFEAPRLLLYAVVILFATTIAFGCKKKTASAPEPQPQAEFYMTAKVDGKDWTANIKNGDNDVAGGTSGQLLTIVGAQQTGKDTTAIVLQFPKNAIVNTTATFDPLQHSMAGFITQSGSYSADPASNGTGAYSIISLNDSSKIVEGKFNFKGSLFQGTGANTVTITDGAFKAVYRDNFSPKPPL